MTLLICCSLSVLAWMGHLLPWLHPCEWSFIFHPNGQCRVKLENPKYPLELALYAWLLSHHIGTHEWKNSQVMGWRKKFQCLKGATIELHWQDCGREKSWRIKTIYWFYLRTGWKMETGIYLKPNLTKVIQFGKCKMYMKQGAWNSHLPFRCDILGIIKSYDLTKIGTDLH